MSTFVFIRSEGEVPAEDAQLDLLVSLKDGEYAALSVWVICLILA